MGKRNRVFQFASIGEIAQDRKYGGEATTTTIGDDNVFREYVTVHAGTVAGPRRHGDRQPQPLPRLHARRARLRRRQPHRVLEQRADRRPRPHRRLGGDGRVRRRAPVLPHRRARDGGGGLDRAAGRAALHDGAGLSGAAQGDERRGAQAPRLQPRGHARDPPRLQGAVPRGPRARGCAQRRSPAPRRTRRCSRRCWPSSRCPAAASSADAPMPRVAPSSAAPLVGIVAGETSGDALAATLIRAMRERHPQVRFAGIAGPKMVAEGCEAWVPMEKLAVRGFAEVLAHLPELIGIRRELRRRFLAERVPLFIGVDAPDFNLGLEARLKRRGVRTIHFVSPSVWAWRGERVQAMARAVDRVLALFPFEPPLYQAAGVPVDYVGHPLAQEAATPALRREVRERFRLQPATPGLRAAARLAALRDRDARRDRAAHGRAHPRGAAGRAVPRAAGDARDARALRRGAPPAGPRAAPDHAALRPRRGCAARRRRRARRLGDGDAGGRARALPARDLLPRDAAHGVDRRAQALDSLGRAAQRARRPLRRARAAAGRRDAR